MTVHNLYLLSPEVALVGVAIVAVLLDLLVRRRGVLAAVVLVGLAMSTILVVVLWTNVQNEAAVFGTMVVDKFALFFKFLVLAIVAVLILGSADYVSRFQRYEGKFYALVLFSATGMMLLAAATELVSIYVSLELTALPLAALAAFLRDERSSEAGIKFLLLSAMSSALLLYGMVLVYGFSGSTQLQEIAKAVAVGDLPFGSYAMLVGVTLMVVGLGFKISMVPFQMWVPDVYEGAPTPITAYLSVASKSAGFAVLLRVFYVAFPAVSVDWGTLFAVLGAVSMTVGNLVAIAQGSIKRMLAYSTVAQVGYIGLGIGLANPLGLIGALLHILNHAFMKSCLFLVAGGTRFQIGAREISWFTGLGHRMPVMMACFTVAALSMVGVPPTAGFFSKWYLVLGSIDSHNWVFVAVILISSLLNAVYFFRIIEKVYAHAPPSSSGDNTGERIEPSPRILFPILVLAAGVIILGLINAVIVTRVLDLVVAPLR